MKILLSHGTGVAATCLEVQAPDEATLTDLARHAPHIASQGVGLEPLLHGGSTSAAEMGADPAPLASVAVMSGPDAGGAVVLHPGRWVTIGRGAGCDLSVDDPSLSRRHFRVRQDRAGFIVEDLRSTNGFRLDTDPRDHGPDIASAVADPSSSPERNWPVDATLEAGSSRFVLVTQPAPPLATSRSGGRLVARPWPRYVPHVEPVTLTRPADPVLRRVTPPSAWAWALPLVAAGVVALALRMPWMLMFGLLGPAMVIGQYLGDRRSARREHREALVSARAATTAVLEQAETLLGREATTRRQRHPGVLGARLALLPRSTTELWCRSAEPPEVVVGEGAASAEVLLDEAPLTLPAAPCVLLLDEPVVVIGPPAIRDAAVRSWLLQLATGHSPSSLTLIVDPDRAPAAWDLLAWLPHTRHTPPAGVQRALVWGRDLILLEDVRDAPPGLTRVVLHDGYGEILTPGSPPRRFTPTLLSLPLARRLARALAAHSDGTDDSRDPGRAVTLGDLTRWPTDVPAVRRRWDQQDVQLRFPLGTGRAGQVVEVDLAQDGPHALIAGTTGSGKSELLRTMVTALALRNDPSRLSFLFIDYKGGSSLAECAQFPHATGIVTDLDPHLAQRVLASLQAELKRREAALAASGVRDARDYTGDDLPRLVIVIDEFRVLADELPEFLDGLVRVAAVGRSLGLHLVLATQRPAGVVSADLKANVNLRIALRVRDSTDSRDVIDSDDAAHLPERAPGRALMRTGTEPPVALLVAPAAPGAATATDAWSVVEHEDVWSAWRTLHCGGVTGAEDESPLAELGALLRSAAEGSGRQARTVWHPPLPDLISSDEVWQGAPRPWAVADTPATQSQEPIEWDASGHIGIVGAGRSGRSTALVSLALGAGPSWVYVLDLGRGLESTPLREHAGVRAWAGPDDLATGMRVLVLVNELIDQRLARTEPHAPVLLVIDGWDRLTEAFESLEGGRGIELAFRVLREGPAAGVHAIVGGDRSLLISRVASFLPQTWALHMNDPTDLLLSGLSTKQIPSHQPPGRLIRTSDACLAQVVQTTAGSAPQVAPDGPPPPLVRELPRHTSAQEWAVGGDEATALPAPAGDILVLGPPRSGVSTALRRLAADEPEAVVVDGPGCWEAADLARALEQDVSCVVVDSAHLLAGSQLEDLVLAWATRTGGRLLVGADLESSANVFRGLVPHVARHRTGVILQPGSPRDGAVLGASLPVGDLRVPGRGVLVDRGRCVRLQVAAP